MDIADIRCSNMPAGHSGRNRRCCGVGLSGEAARLENLSMAIRFILNGMVWLEVYLHKKKQKAEKPTNDAATGA